MELISNYLSKPVISIFEANLVGTVINAVFDKKFRRIISLLLVSDEDESDIKKYIPMNRIETNKNALTVSNKNAIKTYLENNLHVFSPINLLVFDTNGKEIGKVSDVSFNKENFEIDNLILKDNKISAKEVISISNNLVIIKGEGFVKLTAPRRKRKKPPSNSTKDHVQKSTKDISNNIKKDSLTYKTPVRIISDYSFLLNRQVLHNIYNKNGEIIIKENEKITNSTVDMARKHGKLVELTVGSRK